MDRVSWFWRVDAEFRKYQNDLFSIGIGFPMASIEGKDTTKEAVKELVIKLIARYMILNREEEGCFFDMVTENHAHRALFNTGVKDSDLNWWAMSASEYGRSDHSIPPDLQSELDAIYKLRDSN